MVHLSEKKAWLAPKGAKSNVLCQFLYTVFSLLNSKLEGIFAELIRSPLVPLKDARKTLLCT